MMKLVHDSKQATNPDPARRFRGALSALWEACIRQRQRLVSVAEGIADPRARARIIVLSAFNGAQASRLLAHLARTGKGPLPVVEEPPPATLKECAEWARVLAEESGTLAVTARDFGDLRAAWLGEVSQTENADAYRQLANLANGVFL